MPLAEVLVLVFLPFSFLSWGNYNVPIFDRLLGRRHTALVLRGAFAGGRGGQADGGGFLDPGGSLPDFWIHRRLRKVESEVRRGTDWIESLWRHRLIRGADAEVLTSAARVGNLAWRSASWRAPPNGDWRPGARS